MSENLAQQLKSLPAQPGVYIFKNSAGEVLYVGKAKKLRSRVPSYFRPRANLDPAKARMVPKISSLDTILCDTEIEALVLEANLIRQHKPPYNVLLTDDKFYLFIKITNEPLPRIYPVRRISPDGAKYFGPYSSAKSVRDTLQLLRRIFPYHGEKDHPRDRIFPHSLFHTNSNHPAHITPAEYQTNIAQITRFLQGDRDEILQTLTSGMRLASQAHEYERAALFRDQITAIERLEGNQKVYLSRPEPFDVFSLAHEKTRTAANIFSIRKGKLLAKNTFLLKHSPGTTTSDILRQFLLQYYRDAQDIPQRVFLPELPADSSVIRRWINPHHPPRFTIPQRGSKKKLLTMGIANAQQLLTHERTHFEQDARLKQALSELTQALHLSSRPLHRIETYDISNTQGTNATGSMVVFIDGHPRPGEYRKFRLKPEPDLPAGQANDYRMLQQVLSRRFSVKHSDWTQPDLVIIDGGKGQLSSALKIMRELAPQIPVVSLAKQEELLFLPNQSEPVRLPYDSDALYLVQRMRDEAHRFTIQYHRLLRSRRSTRSVLDDIPGIGPKTKRKLLRHFGSIQRLRSSSLAELEAVIGSKAAVLKEFL